MSCRRATPPIELVVRIEELLVHCPIPRGATMPPEGSCLSNAEQALLMAARLQGYEQGQDGVQCIVRETWPGGRAPSSMRCWQHVVAVIRGSRRVLVYCSHICLMTSCSHSVAIRGAVGTGGVSSSPRMKIHVQHP